MRLLIIAIGRMKSGPERELVERYLTRCRASGPGLGLQSFEIVEFAESRKSTAVLRKSEEAKAILGALPAAASLIALDETGTSLTSKKFSGTIARLRDDGVSHLSFVIGGPDGLDHSVRTRAAQVLSFSPLTWPHQLVRIMLAEQIYRATTILAGHPYHRS